MYASVETCYTFHVSEGMRPSEGDGIMIMLACVAMTILSLAVIAVVDSAARAAYGYIGARRRARKAMRRMKDCEE